MLSFFSVASRYRSSLYAFLLMTSYSAFTPPVQARPVAAAPAGLYFMTRTVLGRMEQTVWYFATDGRFYEGLSGFTAKDIAAHKGSKGQFRLAGNTLILRYEGGKQPLSAAVESYTDGGFGYNMAIYSPIRPFTNTGQLAGQYSGGQFIGSGSDGLISSKTLTIRPDGTYTTEGIVSPTSHNPSDVGGQSSSRGRWQWAGYYITMTDGNGRSSQLVTFPIGRSLAFFGGMLYERK